MRDGGIHVVSEVRVDLDADVAVAAVRLLVQRREQIARGANVFDGKLPEDFLRVPARPGERREGGVVIVRPGDGVVEDGRVGGHAADVAAFDHGFEFAVFQLAALDVVHPEGLTEGGEFFNQV